MLKAAVALSLVLVFSACGPSKQAKREEAVRCTSGMLRLFSPEAGSEYFLNLHKSLARDGISSAKAFAVYVHVLKNPKAFGSLDMAKLSEEGENEAKQLVDAKDVEGGASFVKRCIERTNGLK